MFQLARESIPGKGFLGEVEKAFILLRVRKVIEPPHEESILAPGRADHRDGRALESRVEGTRQERRRDEPAVGPLCGLGILAFALGSSAVPVACFVVYAKSTAVDGAVTVWTSP